LGGGGGGGAVGGGGDGGGFGGVEGNGGCDGGFGGFGGGAGRMRQRAISMLKSALKTHLPGEGMVSWPVWYSQPMIASRRPGKKKVTGLPS